MKQNVMGLFGSVVKKFLNSWSARVLQTGQFQAATGKVVTLISGNNVNSTAHGARAGDAMVLTSGTHQYQEIQITEIVDNDNFKIDYSFPVGSEPSPGDTFDVMRPVTASYSSSGALSVSNGPVQFTRNAATQTVIQDTGTPANSRGLPVVPLDTSGNQITLQKQLNIVDTLDTPFFDAAVTNINGNAGAFLQVVASLAADVKKVKWGDDIGEFIGVYTGAAAAETLLYIVGPGGGEMEVFIPSGTRISIRNMKAAGINAGNATVNFLG